MLDKIEYIKEIGLEIEMKDFFNSYKNITNFHYIIDENNKYIITVDVKKWDLFDVKKIFHSFLMFMEYSKGSYYERSKFDNIIEYKLISWSDDLKGFYFKIKFILH